MGTTWTLAAAAHVGLPERTDTPVSGTAEARGPLAMTVAVPVARTACRAPNVLAMRYCAEDDCLASGRWIEATAASVLAAGQLQHVVAVFDDDNDEMRVYVQGNQVASQANDRSLSDLDDVNNWLGRAQFEGDAGFDGELHEFRIYDRALSDAEIQYSFAVGPDPGFL